jgi:hypothetical protein
MMITAQMDQPAVRLRQPQRWVPSVDAELPKELLTSDRLLVPRQLHLGFLANTTFIELTFVIVVLQAVQDPLNVDVARSAVLVVDGVAVDLLLDDALQFRSWARIQACVKPCTLQLFRSQDRRVEGAPVARLVRLKDGVILADLLALYAVDRPRDCPPEVGTGDPAWFGIWTGANKVLPVFDRFHSIEFIHRELKNLVGLPLQVPAL